MRQGGISICPSLSTSRTLSIVHPLYYSQASNVPPRLRLIVSFVPSHLLCPRNARFAVCVSRFVMLLRAPSSVESRYGAIVVQCSQGQENMPLNDLHPPHRHIPHHSSPPCVCAHSLRSSDTPMPMKNPRLLLTLLATILGPPTPPTLSKLPRILLPLPALVVRALPYPATRVVFAAEVAHHHARPVLHVLRVVADGEFFY